jgi:hypothetical protein
MDYQYYTVFILEHLIVDRLPLCITYYVLYDGNGHKAKTPRKTVPRLTFFIHPGNVSKLNTTGGFRHRHFGAWLDDYCTITVC